MADLDVPVVPRASADRVGPWVEGVLRVRVSRPAVDGEANRALVRLVAVALEVPGSSVQLIAGARARRKRLRIHDLDDQGLRERLRGLRPD